MLVFEPAGTCCVKVLLKASIVNVEVPQRVGVPEITTVFKFKESPGGHAASVLPPELQKLFAASQYSVGVPPSLVGVAVQGTPTEQMSGLGL